ncbi:leukemia inhibitory factor receptor-like [Gigantopelta aegis]|uniref:leukemia inhibitory factor receptor-like n=1 Tax=Gigantopelta aegis TaxID=1735272 RepID=UPI001B88A25E|nr:leukemia inhibitory factor receptor-like [Gigantopelta aegis]
MTRLMESSVLSVGNNGTQSVCLDQTLTSCTWRRHSSGGDVFVPGSVYKLQVIVVYNWTTSFSSKVAEAISEEFVIDSRYYVEPAPPTGIVINASTSTCVSVHWQDSTPHRKNKIFRLEFRSEWDTDTKWRTCCNSEESNMKKYSARVCGLVPGTVYTFRVSSKPVPQGFWSDWTMVNATTVGDVPAPPPEVTRGAFIEENCDLYDDCRNVTIFFKPVHDKDKHGKLLEYRLLIHWNGHTSRAVSNITMITIPLSRKMDYRVQLYSGNEFGQSADFSSLSIPSVQKKPPFPESFLVEAEPLEAPSSVTRYLLSWTPASNNMWPTVGYTVYWCQQLVYGTGCKNPLNWISVPTNRSNLQMEFQDSAHRGKLDTYQFGISREVNVKNEIVSSGISWSDCTYQYYKHAKLPDPPEKFKMSPFQEGGSLGVTWDKPSCRRSQPYITHYVISFCETAANKICSDPHGTTNVTVPNTATSYVIGGLKGDVTYKVTIRAASRAGASPFTVAVVGSVKYPGLRPELIAGIAGGALLITALMVWCVCRVYRNVKKKLNIPPASYPTNTFHIRNYVSTHSDSIVPETSINKTKQEETYALITTTKDEKNTKDSGKGESYESEELIPVDDRANSPSVEDTSDGHIDSYAKFAEDQTERESPPRDHVMNTCENNGVTDNHVAHPSLQHNTSFVVGFALSPIPAGNADQNKARGTQIPSRFENRSSPVQNESSPTQYRSCPSHNGSSPIQNEMSSVPDRSNHIQHGSSPIQQESGPVQHGSGPIHHGSGPIQIGSSLVQHGSSPIQHGSSPIQNSGSVDGNGSVDIPDIYVAHNSVPQHISSVLHDEYV